MDGVAAGGCEEALFGWAGKWVDRPAACLPPSTAVTFPTIPAPLLSKHKLRLEMWRSCTPTAPSPRWPCV